jgi:predicted nucleotide-binding protein
MSNLENLSRILNDYDFAVIILTPDDVIISRGNQQKISRDNLIFELGLFMGFIGRNRAFACAYFARA